MHENTVTDMYAYVPPFEKKKKTIGHVNTAKPLLSLISVLQWQ